MSIAPAIAAPDAAPQLADGRYRLVSVLGRGGMATVYLAFDTRFHIWRAVKVLNPALAASSVIRERFLREARTMVRFRHPNVVAVQDMGQDGNRLYIVMELLPGGSVQHHLQRQGPLPPRLAASIAADVLRGLGAVHASNVIHRDVKPANVLLDADGTPKIGDFGIARLSDDDNPGITRSGAAVGTWAFMAPEQKKNSRVVGPAADVYAVGASLFSMLTREEPHDLDRPDVHAQTMEGLPGPLREIIARATRYRAEERYTSTDQMRQALEAAMEELPPLPPGSALPMVLPMPDAPPPPAGHTITPDEPLNAFPQTNSDVPPPAVLTPPPVVTTSGDALPLDVDFQPTRWTRRWGGLGLALVALAVVIVAGGFWRSEAKPPVAPVASAAGVDDGPWNDELEPPQPGTLWAVRTELRPASAPLTVTTPDPPPPPPVSTVDGPRGTLKVEVRGDTCTGWIDGQRWPETLGIITRRMSLPAGPHTIRCESARGRRVEASVLISAGGITPVCLDLTTQRPCT